MTLGAQAAKFVLQLGSTAVLARLLTPADFGLIAMVAVFTGFVGIFKDLGLSMATVQRAQITHEQVSMLFWINLLVSLILTVIGVALAPVVAWVNHEPRLVWVTIALSATFIFGGLAAQHTALLQRQMRFGALAAIDIASLVCSIGVAIVLAQLGASYWALVAMTAAQSLTITIGTWLASRWWPGLPRRRSGVLPMLKFGGHLTGFNLLNYFTRNFDNFIIGAVLGNRSLGIYAKAYSLLLMPTSQINSPIGAVALPALCRLQHEPLRYRSYYLRALELIAFCGMPLVAFTFVEADNLILTILGSQWTAAIPVFRWLAPAAFVGTLNVAPGWLCGSLGTTHRQFRWAMFSAPIIVAGFIVGLRWGIAGVAAGFSLTWSVMHIVFIAYACRGSPVRLRDIGLRVWRPVVASFMAALGTAAVASATASFSLAAMRAAWGAIIFAFAFFGAFLIIPGGFRALRELFATVTHLRTKEA